MTTTQKTPRIVSLTQAVLIAIGLMVALSACNFNRETTLTPTVEGVFEEPINPLPEQTEGTPTPTSSPSPSPSPQPAVVIATGTATFTPGPPTETPSPAPTTGPWEVTVAPGDTLYNMIARPPFNYRNFDVIDEIVALNGLSSAESIFAGQTLLIPRPTPTIVPEGADLTATALAQLGVDDRGVAIGAQVACHTVRDGESAVSIADQYNITLEILRDLNPDINFFGCDFNNPGGGPTCAPILSIEQCVNVPQPTPTPTLSPTPSGSETPTPTPTFIAPRMISPSQGSTASAGLVDLEWVSVGILEAQEFYLVEVTDVTAGTRWQQVTKNTELTLPAELIPTDGQMHEINWRVSLVAQNELGTYSFVGTPGSQRTFFWQSR
ncbi:MAG: LysM domain-containing protein [bacterium]|nr:LysM domain-containing protein [bacterium]